MTNEEFLRDVCPNHTEKSQWNKSELLHILELQKEQLRLHIVSQQREQLIDFSMKRNKAPKEFRSQYEENEKFSKKQLAKSNNDIGKFGDGYEKAINEAIQLVKNCSIPDVVWRSEPLNICNPPKFNDWLSDNFTRRTEYYYDKNSNNETYSIKEIESQYVMKFRTNI